MSEEANTPVQFPQVHLDKMREAAEAFDKRAPRAHAYYRFDGNSHFDTAESAYLAHQLEHMRPGIYQIQYPALKAKSLMPFNTSEVDTGAEQISVETMDGVGEVKVTKGMADDVPMVEVFSKQGSQNIYSLQIGYRYTLQDARAGIYARKPINPRKAMLVKEIMERKLDDIAFVGVTEVGVKGLANQTGTTTYTPNTKGTGGTKTWSTKAPDDILLDMNGAPNQIVTDTNEVEIPDTMLLPIASRMEITSRRMGDGTSSTIMRHFLDNSEYIKRIESSNKLATAGSGSTKRGICYRNDPSRLEIVVSQPFEQLPPQAQGYHVVTLCHLRTAGMALYLPKSVCYFDGV